KLANPNRIVVDIPNSVLDGHARQLAVNSGDVKTIRAARFQSAPPTTRIVVDVAAMHDFELVPAGNKLLLKLKNPDVAAQPVSAPHPVVAQQTAAAPKQLESKPATIQTVAAVQPVSLKPAPADMSVVKAPAADKAPAEATTNKSAQARSDRAAAYFASPEPALLVGDKKPSAHMAAEPAVVNAALQQQEQQPKQPATTSNTAPTSCTSGRYAGAPLNLDLKDLDIKDFFRLIHEISGLNVVLDPSVKGIVTIDVTDIPWDQALAIVLRNNGLECELEGNVLRIATLETLRAEADARRLQQEAQALAVPRQSYTRYLSYAHSKDVVPIIKKFLSTRGDAVADDRSNAIIIEDIPSTLPKVDDLLTKLDRKTPEVEIEARVVAAQRNFARDIGTQIGFGWGNGATSAAGGGTSVPSPIQVTPPGGPPGFITVPNQVAQIPLFTNLPATAPTSGLSFTNFTNLYRLDFVLTMAETRGLVKILSRPRITTQNNIQSSIKQGSRIPVVTQAQLGGPPTVTYVDAFLRLTVTPQITSDNTIFLQLDVENTTPDFSRVTGAQLNPTLNTQQATTQVLVNDGQTVVLGGVIQTQNSLAIGQVPLLGSIPLLGNLFKHTAINTSTAELIFFITPKIIQT
ncbi:MAG TPA: type IV pilus secretin PilQ, partial [Candidatus Angelobacter sp.]